MRHGFSDDILGSDGEWPSTTPQEEIDACTSRTEKREKALAECREIFGDESDDIVRLTRQGGVGLAVIFYPQLAESIKASKKLLQDAE